MKTFLSLDEFVDAYSRGLHAYLQGSYQGDSHIEDLMSATSSYTESAFQFVASMPYEIRAPELKKEEPCPPTSTSAPVAKKKK